MSSDNCKHPGNHHHGKGSAHSCCPQSSLCPPLLAHPAQQLGTTGLLPVTPEPSCYLALLGWVCSPHGGVWGAILAGVHRWAVGATVMPAPHADCWLDDHHQVCPPPDLGSGWRAQTNFLPLHSPTLWWYAICYRRWREAGWLCPMGCQQHPWPLFSRVPAETCFTTSLDFPRHDLWTPVLSMVQ